MSPLFTPPLPSDLGNIVIADSNDETCLQLKSQFEGLGYGVYICQSLVDFVELNAENLKGVILDININGDEAFQVIEIVRQSPRAWNVPIILTSSSPSAPSLIKGLHAGANDYLIKPFSARELASRIQKYSKPA
ncbi:MAG: response regulator [Muribaculaceae bacterium]|nr:response regulator [Muribaculaceae bacterium]